MDGDARDDGSGGRSGEVCASVCHCVFVFVQRRATAPLNSIFNAALSCSVRSLCFVCVPALILFVLKEILKSIILVFPTANPRCFILYLGLEVET